MKSAKATVLGLSIIVMMTAAAPFAFGQAAHVRWDMITPNFGPPVSLNPGGKASATASDTSCITITGSGTFVAPASGESSSAVTGGGTWTVFAPSGANGTVPATCGTTATSSGTFVVTELVRWEPSTAFAPTGLIDNVGNINEAFGGFAVLRVAYSDGSQGVLTISCNSPHDPFAVFEGMIASKGVIQYWYPSIFKYFSLFHVN
jgi:hypothetical protein